MKIQIGAIFGGLCAIIFAVGCGKGVPSDFPPLYPCAITVLADGAPLEGALVALTPDASQSNGLAAAGTTDAAGIAVVTTQGEFKGVPAGKYKISIRKQIREKNEDIVVATGESASVEDRRREYTVRTFIDPKFANPVNTPLTLEIVAGENAETFDVGPQIDETIQ